MVHASHQPTPRDPCRDPESGVWTLSRYAQVLAAFREPRLHPSDSKGNITPELRDESGALAARRDVMAALSATHVRDWQARMAPLADEILDGVDEAASLDLLTRFAAPWCLSLALAATGAPARDAERLDALAARVSAAVVDHAPETKADAGEAAAELDRYFANAPVPMTAQSFIGISRTLPRLLANGWVVLFRHPDEVARLRAEPEWMPRAVEEMLRIAGLVGSVWRKATAPVDLGFARLAAGDRVRLMIASANRDPDQFPDPDRFDVSRHATGQLSLGFGHASCAAAQLIRMAHSVSLAALLGRYERVDVVEEPRWEGEGEGDSEVRWPASLRVAVWRIQSR